MLAAHRAGRLMHLTTLLASYTPAVSLADPPGTSVVVAAVSWLQGALLGTVATVIAVIAVSWIGLMMLSGRTNVRHGLTVIAGCFVLFGASTIAAGIRSTTDGMEGSAAADLAPPPPPAPDTPPEFPPANNDPYAGAAVPAP